jgi:hypothetical protein
MSDVPEKGKIIVDEDWKSQVQAEKERLQHSEEGPKAEPPAAAAGTPAPEKTAEADGALPPPDLLFVVSTTYMQGMMALGLIANPVSGKTQVQLNQARHAIDTVQMLREKTEGNRTPEETEVFDEILHEMRMAFIAVQQSAKSE